MEISKIFDNHDFIKLGELSIDASTKIVILYARFMHNTDIKWTQSTHSHTFFELHFPIHGKCTAILRDTHNTSLGVDKNLLVYPNTNHKFTNFSKDFFRLSVALDIQLNNKSVANNNNYILSAPSTKISTYLNMLLMEYNNQKFGYNNMVNFYIQAIIIEFIRLHPDIICEDKNQSDALDYVFNSALNFIKNNISNKITTNDVSSHVHLSSKQLNRIFNDNINISISNYIKIERIFRVKEHLKKTTLPLCEIAPLTGFNDEYVLCKSFKKITGITPHQYRIKYKRKEIPR